jgi:prepilin-type N-terminal cleavage/methylation domain-containing protein
LGSPRGFTLIELVATLVLVGLIGTFVGFFLLTGASGFLTSRSASETALKAQAALDRIALELRHIASLPSAPQANTRITYTSSSRDLPGTRQIRFNAATSEIFLDVDSAAHLLLDGIQGFQLGWTAADLDASGDGQNEIARIRVEFTVQEMTVPFAVEIYPRGMLPSPSG